MEVGQFASLEKGEDGGEQRGEERGGGEEGKGERQAQVS